MFSSSTWDTQRMHCNTRRDFQNDLKLRFEKSLERYLKTQHRFELSCLTVALQDMSITPSATSNHSSPSVGLGQTPLSSQSSFVRPLQSNSWFQSASRSIWSSGWKKTHTHRFSSSQQLTHLQHLSFSWTTPMCQRAWELCLTPNMAFLHWKKKKLGGIFAHFQIAVRNNRLHFSDVSVRLFLDCCVLLEHTAPTTVFFGGVVSRTRLFLSWLRKSATIRVFNFICSLRLSASGCVCALP